jgi:hypothetical protein
VNVEASMHLRIDAAIAHLEHLHRELPIARRVLVEELGRIDSMATPDGEAGPVSGTGVDATSPTERAAVQRLAVTRRIHDLTGALDDVVRTIVGLRRDCQQHVRAVTVEAPKPRCDGGAGYEGYLLPRVEGGWSYPDCSNIPPDYRRTCDRCRQAAARWKRTMSPVG